jgi:hypothetical protein
MDEIFVATPLVAARRWFDEVTVAAELHDPYASPWGGHIRACSRSPHEWSGLGAGALRAARSNGVPHTGR